MARVAAGDVLLGKYRVDELLGEGGFGRVFRATTLSLGRPVAIKVLKPGADGYEPQRVERFLRELRAIAGLTDPHTLTLYDYGRLDSGLLVMVTEFVPGVDLADLVAQRKLSPGEAAHVMLQVLYSLREAHDAGLLHRDIKPGNIRLYEQSGDPLRVKVLDFGLAMSHDGSESRLTGTGRVIGTPRYMSPEHLMGEPLSPATDIYSLGVVSLEMLLGREAALHLDVTKGRGQRRLPPDSGVTAELATIVNRMLAVEVRSRYATAAEMIAELRSLRRSLTAPRPTPADIAPTVRDLPVVRAPQTVVEPAAEPARAVAPPRGPTLLERIPDRTLVIAAVVTVLVAAAALVVPRGDDDDQIPPVRPPAVQVARVAPVPQVRQSAEAQVDTTRHRCHGAEPPFRGFGPLRRKGLTGSASHTAYIPDSYDGEGQVPLVLFFARDSVEDDASRPEFPVARALAEREQAIVMFVVISAIESLTNNRQQIVERTFATIDAATEALCVDDERLILIGPNDLGPKVVALSCDLPRAVVVTSGGPTEAGPCRRPHLQIFAAEDDSFPVDGWPRCWFGTNRDDACTYADGKMGPVTPRLESAYERKCVSRLRSTPTHHEALEPWRRSYGCPEVEPVEAPSDCRFDACDNGLTGRCLTPGGRTWTPESLSSTFSESLGCSGLPDPDAQVDRMIASFAHFVWSDGPANNARLDAGTHDSPDGGAAD